MALNFDRSPDTDAVINTLRGVNSEISYTEAARRSGLGVIRLKAVLRSARNALRSEGILFGTVVGEGLKRLTDQDKVRKPEAFKKRVMRGAGREIKDLNTISDFGALSKADQHITTLNRTVLHSIRQSAAVKLDKIQPQTTSAPLPNVTKLTGMRK